MNSKTETQSLPINNPPIKKRRFGLFFILIIVLACVGYYIFTTIESSYINHDYYRVLYETSKEFNNNLSKLESSLKNNQSDTSIRAILPTFKLIKSEDDQASQFPLKINEHIHNDESYQYYLLGRDIVIKKHDETESDEDYAKVSLADLLPDASQGFSQLIFASDDGKVIQSSGGEKNISFADLTSIKSEITKQNTPISFSTKGNDKTPTPTHYLPSYSSHFDMRLSYGNFRVFIFPFKLNTPLAIPRNKAEAVVDSLYLVALLPRYELKKHSNGQLTVTLLVVVIVSLLTTLAILRLYLLPHNQSISASYRYYLQGCSYIFFFVIIAMLLAYLSKMVLQDVNDEKANIYLKDIIISLESDLHSAFTGLRKYRKLYHDFFQDTELVKYLEKPTFLDKAIKSLRYSAPDRHSP